MITQEKKLKKNLDIAKRNTTRLMDNIKQLSNQEIIHALSPFAQIGKSIYHDVAAYAQDELYCKGLTNKQLREAYLAIRNKHNDNIQSAQVIQINNFYVIAFKSNYITFYITKDKTLTEHKTEALLFSIKETADIYMKLNPFHILKYLDTPYGMMQQVKSVPDF